MEVKEKSLQEEIMDTLLERLFGKELTKNPPKTLEEEEREQRVHLVFEKMGWVE